MNLTVRDTMRCTVCNNESSVEDVTFSKNRARCPVCGDFLSNGEEVETHHIIAVKDGGTNKVDNLLHLHAACHKQVHGQTIKS